MINPSEEDSDEKPGRDKKVTAETAHILPKGKEEVDDVSKDYDAQKDIGYC